MYECIYYNTSHNNLETIAEKNKRNISKAIILSN